MAMDSMFASKSGADRLGAGKARASPLFEYLTQEELHKLKKGGQAQRLVEKLDQEPTLLVLDNIDTIIKSQDTKDFLETTEHAENLKVLATIRILQGPLKNRPEHLLKELEEKDVILLIRNLGRDVLNIANASPQRLARLNLKLRPSVGHRIGDALLQEETF